MGRKEKKRGTRETRDSTRNGTSRGGHAPFSRLIAVTVAPFPLINSYRKFLRGVHEIRYRDFRLPATTGPLACPHENLPSRSVSVIADAACTPQLLPLTRHRWFLSDFFSPPFGFWKRYRVKDDTSKRFYEYKLKVTKGFVYWNCWNCREHISFPKIEKLIFLQFLQYPIEKVPPLSKRKYFKTKWSRNDGEDSRCRPVCTPFFGLTLPNFDGFVLRMGF